MEIPKELSEQPISEVIDNLVYISIVYDLTLSKSKDFKTAVEIYKKLLVQEKNCHYN